MVSCFQPKSSRDLKAPTQGGGVQDRSQLDLAYKVFYILKSLAFKMLNRQWVFMFSTRKEHLGFLDLLGRKFSTKKLFDNRSLSYA